MLTRFLQAKYPYSIGEISLLWDDEVPIPYVQAQEYLKHGIEISLGDTVDLLPD